MPRSPYAVIGDIVKKHRCNPSAFLTDRRLSKKDQERWVMAMIMIGIQRTTGDCWFLEDVSEEEGDGVALTRRIENGREVQEEIPLEVVFLPECVRSQQWDDTKSAAQNVASFLRSKKLNCKRYVREMNLFVYLNIRLGDLDLADLQHHIERSDPKLGGIWLLACTSPDSDCYLVRQLWPQTSQACLSVKRVIAHVRGMQSTVIPPEPH